MYPTNPVKLKEQPQYNRLNPTRAILKMRLTIAILDTSRLGQGQYPTLFGYNIVLLKISKGIRFKLESQSPLQRFTDP